MTKALCQESGRLSMGAKMTAVIKHSMNYIHELQSLEFSRPEQWSGQPFPFPGDLPNPGMEPRSPALWEDSLPGEPQGKPKNTGVGSLSLFQGIFPTQESNRGLLHCRRILSQLSYQGSPWNSAYLSGQDRCTAPWSQTPLPFIALLYPFNCQHFHLALALCYKMLRIRKSYA